MMVEETLRTETGAPNSMRRRPAVHFCLAWKSKSNLKSKRFSQMSNRLFHEDEIEPEVWQLRETGLVNPCRGDMT
jgi:hypothetical protein